MASQDWFEKDFYATLGVAQDASEDEIKKAYRKLARTWHPDKNPGDAAAEQKFKDIGEAHQVLADPEQRQQYDAVRQMARGGARFGGGAGGAGGFEDVFSSMFGGGGGGARTYSAGGAGQQGLNLEDLLAQFGGAGGGFSGGGFPGGGGYQRQAQPRGGQDVEARASITFRQAVEGSEVRISDADGQSFTARIPAGVKDGQKIRLRGKGRAGFGGGPNGDMILHVSVGTDPIFGRDGDNLTVELPVTFAEATLGATVQVPTFDGKSVKVRVAPGTPSGRSLRVKGRGVKTKKATGDLIAKVHVVVPKELTDEQRQAVETLAAGEADPREELLAKARQAAS
ncbi:DnaJ domain-containing protein [Dermacoccus abyssi]|jgi:molecular chaperone DnaJ|uniref:DnaJ domain-containing protein n=1 Tax=Dermacoccus abyssi TaxID=322596 RepID=A0ABX5Z9T8_9MICO|nr:MULTISPECIES: DnaJ C-terminal domain-containing protein [Dermacoccus]MBE7370323.1 DnaJ domain-containing protein [Dermacoccus barathri]MCT1986097.1 DnaJ domain-containing protein [Dermacoccus abyssi]QEH92534.1 DnaJ domain-containing protein [Dermacoccus abyssi]QNK52848.1 DnaJ domain-containing protein [Dermacoccus sp. PAMC28757]RYI23129.1 J domain-containing protein [Dermacoccus sp. 147Ba]